VVAVALMAMAVQLWAQAVLVVVVLEHLIQMALMVLPTLVVAVAVVVARPLDIMAV